MADGKRPTVATVFGVLNLVFGGLSLVLGVLGVTLLLAAFSTYPVSAIFGILSLGVAAFEVYTGILLLTNKKNAVSLTKTYLIVALAVLAGNIIGTIMQYGMAGVFAGIFTVIIGLVYPALLFFLIVKSEPVNSFYNSQN